MEKPSDLDRLKENYSKIQKKYGLPSFEKLNEEFQIEKIADIETDFLVREVRKCVTDKFFNYLRFIESILTPVEAPMFVFAITKAIGAKEKEQLIDLYKKISKIDVEVIGLDLEYSETKEVECLIKYNDLWVEIKKELISIVKIIQKNWDSQIEGKSEKNNYLG